MKIVPYEEAHEPAVVDFNNRLKAAGETPQFSERHISSSLPPLPGRRLFAEYFLAVDDDDVVRGCYTLKHQDYKIGPSVISIGMQSNLISEGIINRKYVSVGPLLLLHAIRRQPLIYGLGLGSLDEPITELYRAAGWRISAIPFFFRVLRPYGFLRNIQILRRTATRKFLFDALAFSGLGWLGGKIANLILASRAPSVPGLQVEQVDEFSSWADELWGACASEYPYCAVRDSATLNILYVKEKPKFFRLKISDAGKTIGWAVLLATDLKGHKQFADMRLGSIVDVLAHPRDAVKVTLAADRFLREQDVDLIVTNQSYRSWRSALKSCGYLAGPSNYFLATSRKLTRMLSDEEVGDDMFHINRGDGDGPINL